MKEKIIELRKSGLSYNKISEILGCSKSTISYHCKNESLEKPNKHINDDLIECIKLDSISFTIKEIANKYKISESSVKKYSLPKYSKSNLKKCLNCDNQTKNKFCCNKCSSDFRHKESYVHYLNNSSEYCKGNYTPKNFKDFFLIEQNFKCSICNINNLWMNKKLTFVIDHIDGDASNNKRENIRMICPNCDSQTETFKSKNKNSKRRNYWKEKILSNLDINNNGE